MIPREQLPGFHATVVDELWRDMLNGLAARHGVAWMRRKRNIMDGLAELKSAVEQSTASTADVRERAEKLAAVDCLHWHIDRLPEILSAGNWRHHWAQMCRHGDTCIEFEHSNEYQALLQARLENRPTRLPKAGAPTPLGPVHGSWESPSRRGVLMIQRGWNVHHWRIIARNRPAAELSHLQSEWRRHQQVHQHAQPGERKILRPHTHLELPSHLIERIEAMGLGAVRDGAGPQLIVRDGQRQVVRMRLSLSELRHPPQYERHPEDTVHWSKGARHESSIYPMFSYLPMTPAIGFTDSQAAPLLRLQWIAEAVSSNARRHRDLFVS